jgi:dihydroorotate dehydrogenase
LVVAAGTGANFHQVDFYRSILRPILFRLPAEAAHNLALAGLRLSPPGLLKKTFGPPPRDPFRLFGVVFQNRVGLAAGMDKNAVAPLAWEALGFGFMELGTVTALPQPGNPKPRCFRYPAESALINRMGFNNAGAAAVAARLEKAWTSGKWPRVPVGINIGKSKATPNEQAASDYATSFKLLRRFGDYFTINVSSPNTPGLRSLQESDPLRRIVHSLRAVDPDKPLLVKISPDMDEAELAQIATAAAEEGAAGFIATNTTLDRKNFSGSGNSGGLSGTPLREKSTRVIRSLRRMTGLPIIASGGIMDAESAREKIEAGASLVQIYTGFVYSGPALVRDIVEGLRQFRTENKAD